MRKAFYTLLAVLVVVVLLVAGFESATKAQKRMNAKGAQVFINASGDVSVTPASGRTVTIGTTGTGLTRIATYTATLTPAEVAANTTAEQTFTVTGVAVGDIVYVNKPTVQAGLGLCGVRVTATNTVGICFINATASPITPTASQAYTFGVIR